MKEEAIWLLPILNPDKDKALTSERFSFGNDPIRKETSRMYFIAGYSYFMIFFF